MNLKTSLLILLTIFLTSCQSQTNEIENRTIDYYFEQISKLELKELLKQKVLLDSVTISDKFKDSRTNQLNNEGFQKYADIKMNIYLSYFKDYLYQQKVEYKDDIYVLYFTMAGFDDMEWSIYKWNKGDWKNEERLSREKAKKDSSVVKILWNYDEGPKNTENIRIFIQNDYLIMERGNLYHSLYDLITEKVILNKESPFHVSEEDEKEKMNNWIKVNLHDKIEKQIKKKR